jgi:beta-hydroxylase
MQAPMLTRARTFLLDKKRLGRVVDGIGDTFARAERAGLFQRMPAFRYDYHAEYPGLAALEAGYSEVRRECEALVEMRDRLIDVERLAGKYTEGGIHTAAWKAFMFKSHRFIDENCALAPHTAQLLREIPGLYTAFFSILEPRQYITPHWGYWKGFLRYHLGVIIPNDNSDRACWLRVNDTPEDNALHDTALIDRGKKHFWKNGEGVLFDDTFLHDANNGSDHVRVVLWLDLRRKMPRWLDAVNTALLEVAHRVPPISRVRKNAIVKLA